MCSISVEPMPSMMRTPTSSNQASEVAAGKGSPAATILRAISSVAEGEAVFGPGVARRTMKLLQSPRPDTPFIDLTVREREILHHVAAGLANRAIAERMHLSTKTVSNHLTNVFAKLQVASRAEAIVRARSAGLGS